MQRSCKELKRIARENLDNKYSIPMWAYITTFGITLLAEAPFALFISQTTVLYFAQFLISVVAIVLTCGQYRIHLAMARGQNYELKDLFYPVTNQPDRYILSQLLYLGMTVIALLPLVASYFLVTQESMTLMALAIPCSILSAVLVILVTMNFELVFLFELDNEELSVMEAFKKCRLAMKGNKRRYFYMTLSFLGMQFLGALSLGVATIWIQPYMMQTVTAFYLEVSSQLNMAEAQKRERFSATA